MSFQKVIISLASRTNSLYEFDGENVAHLIECGKDGKPSKNVWRKTLIFAEGNVTVKVRNKTMTVVPLSALA